MLSEEKSYSERLFIYKEISSLSEEQSTKAIAEPAKRFGVIYTGSRDPGDHYDYKGVSVFYSAKMCQVVYKNTESGQIGEADVERNLPEFYHVLDTGFFKVRYERCAESDKKFIFAMVKCGELPCTISNVARNLHKNVNSISTTRAQLINEGIIYPVRYKELDFTVPEFPGYIKRLDAYQQWCQE